MRAYRLGAPTRKPVVCALHAATPPSGGARRGPCSTRSGRGAGESSVETRAVYVLVSATGIAHRRHPIGVLCANGTAPVWGFGGWSTPEPSQVGGIGTRLFQRLQSHECSQRAARISRMASSSIRLPQAGHGCADRASRMMSDINRLKREWCPGKDSNLHGREATGT
jgi:hypothetical protein